MTIIQVDNLAPSPQNSGPRTAAQSGVGGFAGILAALGQAQILTGSAVAPIGTTVGAEQKNKSQTGSDLQSGGLIRLGTELGKLEKVIPNQLAQFATSHNSQILSPNGQIKDYQGSPLKSGLTSETAIAQFLSPDNVQLPPDLVGETTVELGELDIGLDVAAGLEAGLFAAAELSAKEIAATPGLGNEKVGQVDLPYGVGVSRNEKVADVPDGPAVPLQNPSLAPGVVAASAVGLSHQIINSESGSPSLLPASDEQTVPTEKSIAGNGQEQGRAAGHAPITPISSGTVPREGGRPVRADGRQVNSAPEVSDKTTSPANTREAGSQRVLPVSPNETAPQPGQQYRPNNDTPAGTGSRPTGQASAETIETDLASRQDRSSSKGVADFASAMKRANAFQAGPLGSSLATGAIAGTGTSADFTGASGTATSPATQATPAASAIPLAPVSEAGIRDTSLPLPPQPIVSETGATINSSSTASGDGDNVRGTGSAGNLGQASATPANTPPRVFPMTPVPHVMARIAEAAAAGETRISLRLIPAELGQIDVNLKIRDGGLVQATIVADRSDTLDMLARDQRDLERALQQAGIDTNSGNLDFNLKEGREDPEGENADDQGSSENETDFAAAAEQAASESNESVINQYEVPNPGGLDIKI